MGKKKSESDKVKFFSRKSVGNASRILALPIVRLWTSMLVRLPFLPHPLDMIMIKGETIVLSDWIFGSSQSGCPPKQRIPFIKHWHEFPLYGSSVHRVQFPENCRTGGTNSDIA